MTEVRHERTLAEHPDALEMRARYSRVLGGRDVVFVDGPVFLAGLYCAISPWVVNFVDAQPDLLINNLITGIAIGLLALGLTMVPERMYGLSWAICAIGAWLIVSPWVVGNSPDGGIIVNNIILGGVVFLLGLASAAAAMRVRKTTQGAAP
jgi:hypothetical protein